MYVSLTAKGLIAIAFLTQGVYVWLSGCFLQC